MPQPITDVDLFSDVTAPASADPLDETEVVATAQQLANRTKILRDYLRADRHVPILAGVPVQSGGADMWALSTGGLPTWISQVNTAELWIPLFPWFPGDFLDNAYVLVKPGAARTGTDRMGLTLVTRALDYGTPGAAADTVQVSTVRDDGTTNYQKITLSPVTPVSAQQIYVRILAGNTGAANADQVLGIFFDLDLGQVIT